MIGINRVSYLGWKSQLMKWKKRENWKKNNGEVLYTSVGQVAKITRTREYFFIIIYVLAHATKPTLSRTLLLRQTLFFYSTLHACIQTKKQQPGCCPLFSHFCAVLPLWVCDLWALSPNLAGLLAWGMEQFLLLSRQIHHFSGVGQETSELFLQSWYGCILLLTAL